MNKKTPLLAILGLVTVSGAGYMYTSGQTAQLPQQIGQYLPAAVRDYLPASFSPAPVVEKVVKQEGQDAQVANAEAPGSQQENVEVINSKAQDLTQVQDEATMQHASGTEIVTHSAKNDNAEKIDIAGINSDIINEIEQSVSSIKTTPADTVDVAAVEETATKEIQDLKRRLQQIHGELGGLDTEKSELEDKIQIVLKENRALAMKLQQINQQLEQNVE